MDKNKIIEGAAWLLEFEPAIEAYRDPPKTLEELRFANSFAALGDAFSEVRSPTGIPNARLVAFSPAAAQLIDLRPGEEARPAFLAPASGNALVPGMEPAAAMYGGHQFGVWAGQLGDGRAIVLGEVVAPGGRYELQLKGSGQTPYSRMGDGRAVLRSSIREFLCSEAMHHLGIPTTRALAVVGADQPVLRETVETAAVVRGAVGIGLRTVGTVTDRSGFTTVGTATVGRVAVGKRWGPAAWAPEAREPERVNTDAAATTKPWRWPL